MAGATATWSNVFFHPNTQGGQNSQILPGRVSAPPPCYHPATTLLPPCYHPATTLLPPCYHPTTLLRHRVSALPPCSCCNCYIPAPMPRVRCRWPSCSTSSCSMKPAWQDVRQPSSSCAPCRSVSPPLVAIGQGIGSFPCSKIPDATTATHVRGLQTLCRPEPQDPTIFSGSESPGATTELGP